MNIHIHIFILYGKGNAFRCRSISRSVLVSSFMLFTATLYYITLTNSTANNTTSWYCYDYFRYNRRFLFRNQLCDYVENKVEYGRERENLVHCITGITKSREWVYSSSLVRHHSLNYNFIKFTIFHYKCNTWIFITFSLKIIKGGGQNLERPNTERSIFRKFKILKVTKNQ